MATAMEAAIAAELGEHIDDIKGEPVLDAEGDPMGVAYDDTSQQSTTGTILPPNEFHIVLENDQRFLVTVTYAGKA